MKNTVQKIIAHQFHRNGIGGSWFFAVRFTYRDPHDEQTVELIATIEPERADATRVIDPTDVTLQFRGDFFFREIARALGFSSRDVAGFWSSDPVLREKLADRLSDAILNYREGVRS